MLVVPTEVKTAFTEFLVKKGIAQKHIYKCQKYLRYYLDFCQKYRHGSGTSHGLEGFLLKLVEKKQEPTIRKEAQRAVQLYQEYLTLRKNDSKRLKNDEVTKKKVNIDKHIAKKDHNRDNSSTSVTKSAQKDTNRSSWKSEFAGLENTIRMRHYSDKTLRSYRKYVRDFQAYTQCQRRPDNVLQAAV